MKQRFTLFSTSIILFFIFSKALSQELTPEQIFEKVNDCVVVILSYDFNGNLSKQGSGVVISEKGWVVTNYHIFAECESIEIKHNNNFIKYTDIIGADIEKDILILKIDENIFPSILIADTNSLKIGQRIYAIGSPMGLENSLSEGLISGLRNVLDENRSYIQITASISQGSSGGAVVNTKGELIGLSVSSIKTGQNLNFAIPIKDVMNISINTYNDKKDTDANNYFYKGFNADENGKFEEAIQYYSLYLEIFPDDYEVYCNRGLAFSRIRDYNNALSDFDKAIQISPTYINAWNNRGVVNMRLRKFDKAIIDFNSVLEIDLLNELAYHNRGIAYMNLNEYETALTNFFKAIEINPKYSDVYNDIGEIYTIRKNYKEAISNFNRAIEINPNKAVPFCNRGLAYRSIEEYQKAISDFNIAIQIDPFYSEAYSNRGNTFNNLFEYENAISDLNKAIELNPFNAVAYQRRSMVYYNMKIYYKACEDIKKAISLGYPGEEMYKIICNN